MSDYNELKEKLFLKHENGLKNITEKEWNEIIAYCEDYKKFLNASKTEREAVKNAIAAAKEKGFKEFSRN